MAECIAKPSYDLRLLTRSSGRLHSSNCARITTCDGDLLDTASLRRFVTPGCTLVHLAYLTSGSAANLRAAANLAKVAKERGVRRVVHCSTAVVIGFSQRGIVTEDTPALPRGEYQATKLNIEQLLRADLHPAVELAILRPTEVIGPGGKNLQPMIERVRNRSSFGNGLRRFVLKSRQFNYVSVHNVVAALLLLANTPATLTSDVYNISDDDDPDNNYGAVETIIASLLERKTVRLIDPALPKQWLSMLFRLLPEHAPPDRIYSHSRISALGYRKVISLRAAIAEMVPGVR